MTDATETPTEFDITSLFKQAILLNAFADEAREAGWEVRISGADNLAVEVSRLLKGDVR